MFLLAAEVCFSAFNDTDDAPFALPPAQHDLHQFQDLLQQSNEIP